jgi:hypothetical protein
MTACQHCGTTTGDPGGPSCPECGAGPRFVTLANVAPEHVNWVWPGRLPAGKLATLDGDPGLGKSTLVLDIAARITNGGPMPDGHELAGPADVIVMSAEDGMADTIRPRLDAAGADVSRVHVFASVTYADDHGRLQTRPPSIPADIDALEHEVARTGAALVVIDVLNAFLAGTVDSYRDQDVRRVLHRLAIAAEHTGAVIVVLRHLSKSGGDKAIYRGGGSIGIIGAARVGLIVGIDPGDPNRNVLAVVKSNLAAIPKALAYQLVDAAEHGCARVLWLGTVDYRANDLVGAPNTGQPEDLDASGALTQILASGPLWVKQAQDAMAEAGFTKEQTRRAKEKLNVRSVKVGRPGDSHSGWQWVGPDPAEDGRLTPEDGKGGTSPEPAAFATFVPPSGPAPEATNTQSVHNGSRNGRRP